MSTRRILLDYLFRFTSGIMRYFAWLQFHTNELVNLVTVRYALSGPFSGLQFDPDPSIPDSLGAHGHFYFRFNGFKYFVFNDCDFKGI